MQAFPLSWNLENVSLSGLLRFKMNQIPFITTDSLALKPMWQGAVDAIVSGHALPKARIADSVLERGSQRLLSRAAWIDGLGSAVKTVSIYPDNPAKEGSLPSVQGACMLFEDGSGRPYAIIDSELLTYWKTAADSVLGAKLVGPTRPCHLVIIGAGKVARSLLEAYAALFPSLCTITVCARRLAAAEQLIAEVAIDGLALRASNQPETIVPTADIVVTATSSSTPVLQGEWLKPGAHVDLVGAYSLTMREADDATLERGALYVDSRETTIKHIGELAVPIAARVIGTDDVQADFYDLLASGRVESGDEIRGERITVFKNGGGAHLDLMVAQYLKSLLG